MLRGQGWRAGLTHAERSRVDGLINIRAGLTHAERSRVMGTSIAVGYHGNISRGDVTSREA